MSVIIDPPVTPYSPRSEIEAWIENLKQMRLKFADDAKALEAVDFNIKLAQQWLDNRPQGI